MTEKFDGIIEAARYKNGQIVTVRAYERRGSAFSDCVLIDRKTLAERLQAGKKFFTGSRAEFMGGSFKADKRVYFIKHEDRETISTSENADKDALEGVSVF